MAASCCGGSFAAGGTGELHKIDYIMKEEHYVETLKQHLRTSTRKLKLPMDKDPHHTATLVTKWLKDNKVLINLNYLKQEMFSLIYCQIVRVKNKRLCVFFQYNVCKRVLSSGYHRRQRLDV